MKQKGSTILRKLKMHLFVLRKGILKKEICIVVVCSNGWKALLGLLYSEVGVEKKKPFI